MAALVHGGVVRRCPPRGLGRGLGGRPCRSFLPPPPQRSLRPLVCPRPAPAWTPRASATGGHVELWTPGGRYGRAASEEGAGGARDGRDALAGPACLLVAGAVETKPPFEGSMLSSQPPGGPPPNDYYAQTGLAIRTIRDEVPHVFQRDISYDIFTEDVGFVDNITARSPDRPHIIMGKEKYKGMYKTLRWHGKLFFTKLKVDILRIWQPKDKVIAVRWTVTAVPRLLNGIIDSTFYLDGISEYKLNDDGFIYQHKVDNVDMNTGQQAMQWSSLQRMLAGSQAPMPTMFVGEDPLAPDAMVWVDGETLLTAEKP